MRMNKARLRVSIVIPAYNEEGHLRPCLEAIQAQTVQPFEVIVVNNNSNDSTAAMARSFPFVRVIDEPQQGRVFARNAGFDAARGDVIGRIDADIRLPRNWVEHVQTFYEQPGNDQKAWTGSGYFPNIQFPRLVSFCYALLAFQFNKLLLGHCTLWGSNMAITRNQWRRIGSGACKRNDIHEDLDLAIHLADAGYHINYDKSIKTNAELRRVQAERHELWEYLLWWPRTLRIHARKGWVVAWWLSANLYVASFFWLALEKFTPKRSSASARSVQ
jgi:glycosyltransferase involved in cell wall biosynthesis